MVLKTCEKCGNDGMPFEMGGPILVAGYPGSPKGHVHWGCLTDKEQAKVPEQIRGRLIERGFALPSPSA